MCLSWEFAYRINIILYLIKYLGFFLLPSRSEQEAEHHFMMTHKMVDKSFFLGVNNIKLANNTLFSNNYACFTLKCYFWGQISTNRLLKWLSYSPWCYHGLIQKSTIKQKSGQFWSKKANPPNDYYSPTVDAILCRNSRQILRIDKICGSGRHCRCIWRVIVF